MMHHKQLFRRALSALTAVAILCCCAPVFAAGNEIAPSCDEAYYATLDYYGEIEQSSVVKSYTLNGAKTITDFGQYDEVVNLTNTAQAQYENGALTFALGDDAPEHFYFEGKTAEPFSALPWEIALSYRLNGVPKPAEELAGASGLVEINIDAMPNSASTEYCRNNFVLQAVAIFNADDILSLEAPGAQVQLVGNLRIVLFMAMPGEEQHFTMRIGSDDFTFSGMTFLMVPATLSQLAEIKDLREAKEKAEDSFTALNDSMDTILNTLDGMSGSLNTAADGLTKLNEARSEISSGKSDVYTGADAALSDLGAIADALAPLDGHLTTAEQAVTDMTDILTQLTQNASDLKPLLAQTRDTVEKLKTDSEQARDLIETIEDYGNSTSMQMGALRADLTHLGDDMSSLKKSLAAMETALGKLKGLSPIAEMTFQGMTISEIREKVSYANTLHKQYLAYLEANSIPAQALSFTDFLVAGGASASDAASLTALWSKAQTEDFQKQLEEAETANGLIGTVNGTINEVNTLIAALAQPTAGLLEDLRGLCDSLGSNGLSGDLKSFLKMADSLLEELEDNEGLLSGTLKHFDEAGDTVIKATENADQALDLITKLDDTLNTYVPDTQQALADARTLSSSAQSGIRNTRTFLQTLENLMKKSGVTLDAGTKQTLDGLTDTLRRSASGLDETDSIRASKDTLKALIDDEWDAYTGENNNLLLMDAQASPVSLTSERNASPASLQVLMRSEEIKKPKVEPVPPAEDTVAPQGNVFTRIGDMFRDFWAAITSFFHHGN